MFSLVAAAKWFANKSLTPQAAQPPFGEPESRPAACRRIGSVDHT